MLNTNFEEDFISQLYIDLENDNLTLPTLPEVALKVREVIEDEDASLADVAKVVAQDTALSARLIQIVNSPLLRSVRVIENVDAAVMRMGSSMVRNVVTSMVMKQLFRAKSSVVNNRLRASWQKATDTSARAMVLSANVDDTQLTSDQAMLAGLVQEIGILPILSRAEQYPELLENSAVLDSIIDKTHSKLGGAILQRWYFPEEIIAVTRDSNNIYHESINGPDYVDLMIIANLQCLQEKNQLDDEFDWSVIPAYKKLQLSTEIGVDELEMTEELKALFENL